MEAVPVDLPVRDDPDDHLLGAGDHGMEELLAALGCALLRVVQVAERPHLVVAETAVVQEDARNDQRAGKAAAPGLVGAGNKARAELSVEPEELLSGPHRHGGEDTALLGGGLRAVVRCAFGTVARSGFRRGLSGPGAARPVLSRARGRGPSVRACPAGSRASPG